MDRKSLLHLKKCSYRNCKNNNRRTTHITYYTFPIHDPDRCIEWMVNSGCENFVELSNSELSKKYICNKHFANTCFFAPRLIKTAVPDLYEDNDNNEIHDNKVLQTKSQDDLLSSSPGSNNNRSITNDGNSQKLTEEIHLLSSSPGSNNNRSITDDGTSQQLSEEEIHQLQECGKTSKKIVDSLIENDESCMGETEKNLKKQQKKYCKYVTIHKLQISSLQGVYFKLGGNKHGIMRIDALAQLLSYCDVQSEGLYLLYNSGSQGLPVAAMLNRIGANTKGHLIHLHPESITQNFMVQAMKFPKEQLERLFNVNIYNFLRLHYQGNRVVSSNIISKRNNSANTIKETEIIQSSINKQNLEGDEYNEEEDGNNFGNPLQPESSEDKQNIDIQSTNNYTNVLKRKLNEYDKKTVKKPKWLLEAQCAVHLLQDSKARGLAIVAKEHPLNIINALLPFLGISRPFVIYHAHREPLQETYFHLKQRQNIINLRFFSNFLRSYKVLHDRTLPDIVTSDTDGYLLTGYLVE